MKRLLKILIISLLLFSFLTIDTYAYSERIAGQHRYQTAVNISKAGWNKADTVVLAIGDNFPDALAGAPLAYKENAPILLVQKNELGWTTKQEIKRLKAKRAIILGSTNAISKRVEKELKSLGVSYERIGGKDRYETAALIAQRLGKSDKAIIAYGKNFPDALAIAPYAAKNGYPILLSDTNQLPKATKEQLKGKKETIVVGGKTILSEKLLQSLPNPKRVAGGGRYETAVAIAKAFHKDSTNLYIATGDNFADALTGSVLAAKNNGTILLVYPDIVPSAVDKYLNNKQFISYIALGGETVVSKSVLESITNNGQNNSLKNAYNIKVNTKYTAQLAKYNDHDYYKFILDNPGNVTIQFENKANYSWHVKLLNKDGSELQKFSTSSKTDAPNETNYKIGLPAGEYYIHISGSSATEKVPYSFTVKYEQGNYYEKENNNTIETATPMELNKKYHGTLQDWFHDVDYYKFTLKSPGEVSIQMSLVPGSRWDVVLVTEDGKYYTSFTTDDSDYVTGTTNRVVGLPAGTYYVKISDRWNTEYIDYSLTIKYTQGDHFEKEFNNTITSANNIETNKYYRGTIQHSDDIDFYKFTLPKNGVVNVSVSEIPDTNWQVRLINRNGNEYLRFFTNNDEFANGMTSYKVGLPKGEYFLVISHNIKTSNIPYKFKVDFEETENWEKEFNNNISSANKIKLNERYYGILQNSNSKDYFYFVLQEKSTIKLNVYNGKEGWYYEIYDTNGNKKLDLRTDTSQSGTYPTEKSATVVLEPGKYYLKVDYFYSRAVGKEYYFEILK